MTTPQTEDVPTPREGRRVILASLAGTTVEWYEFFIYGTAAALALDQLFFPEFDPIVGSLLAMATFAVAFVARPLGGIIFGHFGDRVGRKSMLVITLTMMGLATFCIGLVPTYETIGPAAPVLLVALRLLQGLSLGGEYGGAVLMSVEHATQKRRGLFGAIVNTGSSWGLLLGNGVFLAVTSQLSDAAFEAWGWRIPFLASSILVALGLFIRLKLFESPDFEHIRQKGEIRRLPVGEVLRYHPVRVVLMCCSYLSAGVTFYVATVFSLSYGTQQLGVDRSLMLGLVAVTNGLIVVGMPIFGWLSDHTDRKRLFLAGAAGMAVLPYAWFSLLGTRHPGLMLLGFLLLFVPFCANYGTMPTFFAHVFPPRVRYTGLSVGYTMGTVVGSAVSPLVATGVLGYTGSWPIIAAYMSAMALVTGLAALFLKEEHGLPAVASHAPRAVKTREAGLPGGATAAPK